MPATKSFRIAIFEDSAQYLRQLEEFISDLPGTEIVATASAAPGAGELIQQHKPDFVLIDFFLAKGTALDVLRDMREFGISADAVVMTTEPGSTLEEACRALGATAFLDKATLSESITSLLSTDR
jgi:DNA-binding NarL/FixJ family response regulator